MHWSICQQPLDPKLFSQSTTIFVSSTSIVPKSGMDIVSPAPIREETTEYFSQPKLIIEVVLESYQPNTSKRKCSSHGTSHKPRMITPHDVEAKGPESGSLFLGYVPTIPVEVSKVIISKNSKYQLVRPTIPKGVQIWRRCFLLTMI